VPRIEVDQLSCTACHTCEVMCSVKHFGIVNLAKGITPQAFTEGATLDVELTFNTGRENYDIGSLRYCASGGDALPREIAAKWLNKFKRPLYQGYGSTETGGVSGTPIDEKAPMGSCGRVLPYQTIKLIDPDSMRPVSQGRPGEMLVSSEHMVREYWNKPEETSKCFIELDNRRWYRTGDMVRMDEGGWLFFVDRTADIIKHKGYRISCSEIEMTLQDHPSVAAVCVVGVPDKNVGERIKAFVVLKEDLKGVSAYELIKWCKDRLTYYKVPSYIEFRDMLPKSKVGKILRRELRLRGKERLDDS